MAVSYRKQSARNMDREIEDRASDQLLIVKIAGMRARRTARKTVYDQRRGNTDRAPKRSQLQSDTAAEFGDSGFGIEPDHLEPRVRKLIGQCPAARAESSHAKGMQVFESKDVDLQNIPRLGSLDINGARERMCSGTSVCDRLLHLLERVRDFRVWDTGHV